jgi:hypothetical protein
MLPILMVLLDGLAEMEILVIQVVVSLVDFKESSSLEQHFSLKNQKFPNHPASPTRKLT